MKALDIAIVKENERVVLITQVSSYVARGGKVESASVEYIGPYPHGMKVAWFDSDELEVIDSLPLLLARIATRPGGSGFTIDKDYFG